MVKLFVTLVRIHLTLKKTLKLSILNYLSTAKERTVVLVYDISYERLDTSEEYRQEMREFQMAEPDVAKDFSINVADRRTGPNF